MHFTDNDNEICKTDENYNRLRKVLNLPNDAYKKYYNSSQYLTMDQVIVLFKGENIFKQYFPKKTQVICNKNININCVIRLVIPIQ